MERSGPYRFAVTFRTEDAAQTAAQRAGAEFVREGTTVRVSADDFVEGYRKSIRLYGAGTAPPTAAPPASTPGRFWGARLP